MRKNWMKRTGTIVMMAIFLVMLSGCSLAIEGAGVEKQNQDRLIGVFITTESIHSFNAEIFPEEGALDLNNGDSVDSIDKSEERIYATIEKHGSTKPEDWEIQFGDYEGRNFFNALHQPENEEPFTMLWMDGVCDPYTGYHSTDEGDNVEIKGTVYVGITKKEIVFYNNPVYQTPEGQIYTVAAMGCSFGNPSEGITMTETWTGEISKTEDGKKITEKSKVEITYKCSYEPKQILVHQMDENNGVVKTESYEPGILPEELNTEENTSYLIIETKWDNPQNQNETTRVIYEKDSSEKDYFETLYKTEDSFLEEMSTRVLWGK